MSALSINSYGSILPEILEVCNLFMRLFFTLLQLSFSSACKSLNWWINLLHVLQNNHVLEATNEQKGGAEANRMNFLLLRVGLTAAI